MKEIKTAKTDSWMGTIWTAERGDIGFTTGLTEQQAIENLTAMI